jgi:hypothetical protein
MLPEAKMVIYVEVADNGKLLQIWEDIQTNQKDSL